MGPAPTPESHCESPCTLDGEMYSCRERVHWLVKEGGSSVAAALDLVSHECDGQCTCSPSELSELQCESPCTFDGETYSCRERVHWLVEEGGSTVAAALDLLSHECDGQCTCSLSELSEFQCESPCTFDGETYSCRERVQWLAGEGGSEVAAALETVGEECSGQCRCTAADFAGQMDLLTSLSSVTSLQPPPQGSTTQQTVSE